MRSESDSVAPISAPNTGPDPRIAHQLDPPDANPDPGFNNGGIRTMAAGAGPGGDADVGPMQAEPDGGGGYGVDSTELGKMADELDLAALILEKADKGLSESDATARMHSMLDSGRMLQSTTSDWDAEITRLAKQCRSLADKLRQTHTNYTTQEFRTAQDFQAILASSERGA
ncbi:hypothetical protein [Streptomyces beijiangensis]|uniref:Uncharacterized protein n=1 Tax=Streptomyces beijiangensis TaxID=163361 RepID=A0A939FD82_9ACTN|nr:hypothetical protein [Streptomyces beijiangensis]MBO0515277.1 hypothetical protein [Streptomyces beijiangensis]